MIKGFEENKNQRIKNWERSFISFDVISVCIRSHKFFKGD